MTAEPGSAGTGRESPSGPHTSTLTRQRADSRRSTAARELTNTRTRLVGQRTGLLADGIVAIVQFVSLVRGAARRAVTRVTSVVTPVGWTMAVLMPVSLVAGYVFGWIELVAIAFACLALIILAILWLVGRTSVRALVRLEHRRVIVGAEASADVIVTNIGRRRTLAVAVEVPVGSSVSRYSLPGLRAGASNSHRVVIPTERRGIVEVGPARTVRADPIGLVRRETTWAGAETLFVHPRTVLVPSMSTGFIRDLEGNPTRMLSSDDVSFHALREYMTGDDRRTIHWKSTARTGTFMVRQFEQTRRSHLMVALSLSSADYSGDEEFELAVSVAGSLGISAIRNTRAVSVLVSATTPEYAKRKVFAVRMLSTLTRTRLLDDLAVIHHGESALGIADVARVASEQATGVSVVFLVCGSGATTQKLRAAAGMFPLDVEVIAVVCNPEGSPGLRRVAGLGVLTIGYLEDLAPSLARVVAG